MKIKVLHYKKSKIAHAPDILVQCINKYSKNYQAFLYAESGEYLKHAAIPVVSQPLLSRYDIIHFHNRFVPCNLPKLIQYHSPSTPNNDPPWADLSFNGQKIVIAQYQATLDCFQNMPIVRNIIDLFSDEYMNHFNYNGEIKNHKIKIAYSPSVTIDATGSPEDKGYNKTVEILDRVRKNKGVDVDIIQGVSLPECLQRKAACNILIDECVTNSYHRCTLEGLALGRLTICSIGDEVLRVVDKICGSRIPVENIWINDLEAFLDKIIDKGLPYINRKGGENRMWMENNWHPKDIVKEFDAIYDNILDEK